MARARTMLWWVATSETSGSTITTAFETLSTTRESPVKPRTLDSRSPSQTKAPKTRTYAAAVKITQRERRASASSRRKNAARGLA